MSLNSCYLCGQPIEDSQVRTGDHVVPTALIGKKQPKVPGFEYGGRIPTHQACNNHFSDETYFQQALHLVSLIRSGLLKSPLQSVAHEQISFVPVTTDQVPNFHQRDFRRFNFIDTRNVQYEELNNPDFYRDKTKTNLLQVSLYASMTVFVKSAAALLVRKHLRFVPSYWRIQSAMFDADNHSAFEHLFFGVKPFSATTRALIKHVHPDEWIVLYQHKNLLGIFLFVFHKAEANLAPHVPAEGAEIHMFEGHNLNALLEQQWQLVEQA